MKELEALKIAEDMMFESLTNTLKSLGREGIKDIRLEALGTVRRMIDTRAKYGKIIAFKAGQRQNGS
jgi:hypothetical protein